jgi:hypothetical protein
MRLLGLGAALCLAAATAACSSGDTGSGGGWRVSGRHISIASAPTACRTPSPVLDTFSAKPTPEPGCSPPAKTTADSQATPQASSAPADWHAVHVEQQYHAGTAQWHPIYTTYTAPPGVGVYQPMVHATNQPMPTPFTTPTPQPLPSPSTPIVSTQPPVIAQPSSIP